jgi:hypothetical protein
VLATGFALYLLGCGGAQPAAHTPDDLQRGARSRDTSATDPFTDVRLDPQAQTVEVKCAYGTYEECNAIDDDCNGVIDDECGYESGAIQITVGWNSGADIDLYVTDPSGATVYYNEEHKRSPFGGHLDHDARGNCRREQKNPRIENAYWPAPARAGKYRVELNYFSPCAQATTTEATVTVVVDGQLLGTYRYVLEPEQRVEALTFVKR